MCACMCFVLKLMGRRQDNWKIRRKNTKAKCHENIRYWKIDEWFDRFSHFVCVCEFELTHKKTFDECPEKTSEHSSHSVQANDTDDTKTKQTQEAKVHADKVPNKSEEIESDSETERSWNE